MLSRRLQAVADAVGSVGCVLDMGCDHGYIPLALIRNGQARHVIASDISAPSLSKTRDKVKAARLDEWIETRLGNGLAVIRPQECDAVIMAGMGGLLIADCIRKDRRKIADARLVLQPMNHAADLRLVLEKAGFAITQERVVYDDGHFYQIIVAEAGAMHPREPIDYWVGYAPARRENDDFKQYIRAAIASEEKIIARLKDNRSPNARRRLAQGVAFQRMLEEVLS